MPRYRVTIESLDPLKYTAEVDAPNKGAAEDAVFGMAMRHWSENINDYVASADVDAREIDAEGEDVL